MTRKTYITGDESREKILQAIKDKIESRGFSPTIQELAYNLDMSITNITYHLGILEKLGKIERKRYQARGIRILEDVQTAE